MRSGMTFATSSCDNVSLHTRERREIVRRAMGEAVSQRGRCFQGERGLAVISCCGSCCLEAFAYHGDNRDLDVITIGLPLPREVQFR